jgi:hypothetical protein
MFFETDTGKWYSVIGRRLTKHQVTALATRPGSQTILDLAADCFAIPVPSVPSTLSVAKG